MPIARVQLPDGRIARVEVPEGTTPEQALAFAKQAAGKEATPQAKPSLWQQAKDIGVNGLAAAAEAVGSVPDALMQGTAGIERGVTNALGAVGGAGLRAVGLAGAADSLDQGVRRADNALARTPTIRGAVERAAPVKPGYETSRMVTEFGVGAMLPFGPKGVRPARIPRPAAANPAQQVVQDGVRNNTRVFTTDLKPPRTAIGKAGRKLGELIPLAGTSGGRQAQQAERIEAVKAFAREFDMPDTVVDDVAKDLTATRGAAISQLSARKTAVIEGTQGIALPTKTLAALDAKITELTARDTQTSRQVAEHMQAMRPDFEGKTIAQLEAMRTDELAGAFKGDSLAHIKDLGEKSLRAIYDPLRQDMGDHIRAVAGPDAFRQWRIANARLSGMIGELNSSALKSVLNKAASSPEDVEKLLFNTKPSQVRLLYNNLSAAGRTKAQGAIIRQAMTKAKDGTDNISPDKFANEIDRLGKSVGVFFQQGDMARVQGLSRLIAHTKRAAQAGVVPENGAQVLPWAIPTVLTQLFGIPGGVGVAGGAGLAARAYESAPVRNALLKLGRTKAGSPQEAVQLNRVAGMIAPLIERGKAALNDNVPLRASAGEGPEQQQQQQAAPQP